MRTQLALFGVLTIAATQGAWAQLIEKEEGGDSVFLERRASRNLHEAKTRILLVHMLFMVITWLLLAPAAILVARFGRTYFKWYPHHRNIQIATMIFFIIGFGLGVKAASPDSVASKKHYQVGVAIFILFFFQCALGFWSHNIKSRWVGFVHAPIGLVLFGLSIWNMETGFNIWYWDAGKAPKIVVYAWMGFLVLLYLVGFAFLPREIKQHRAAKVDLNEKEALPFTTTLRSTSATSDTDTADLA